MRILIIEKDKQLAILMKEALHELNTVVDLVFNPKAGIEQASMNIYHCIFVSYDFLDMNGTVIIRNIRRNGSITPIIATGSNLNSQKVNEGLIAGFNDFIPKPFSSKTLILRFRITMNNFHVDTVDFYKVGDIEFYPSSHKLMSDEDEIRLTKKESELLKLLVINQRIPMSKAQIIDHLWTNEATFNENNIEVHISNLRKKLKENDLNINIETVRNAGYSLKV